MECLADADWVVPYQRQFRVDVCFTLTEAEPKHNMGSPAKFLQLGVRICTNHASAIFYLCEFAALSQLETRRRLAHQPRFWHTLSAFCNSHTHFMSISKNSPYLDFGRLFRTWRLRAGIAKQTEIAKRLEITQQTISRWERGLSRPRHRDIARIAVAIACDEKDLYEAAGYLPNTDAAFFQASGASFDRPFPVNALSPESFERFCAYLLQRLYRDAQGQVHRAGGDGHRQGGIDISVTGSFGIHTFQCKRVEEFGPQKVRDAIAKDTVEATSKFLLLSNIASPQARAVLSDHPKWQLWDREDISARVRSLSRADQRDLVDVFFRGSRLELLGEAEAGPSDNTRSVFRSLPRTRPAV